MQASEKKLELEELESQLKAVEAGSEALIADVGNLTVATSEERTAVHREAARRAEERTSQLHAWAQEAMREIAEFQAVSELQELLRPLQLELQDAMAKSSNVLQRLKKASDLLASIRTLVYDREFDKAESRRLEVVAKLRTSIEAQGHKVDTVFDTLAKTGGLLSREDLVAFVQQASCDVNLEKLELVFFPPNGRQAAAAADAGDKAAAAPEAAALPNAAAAELAKPATREEFLRLMRVNYKVVKEIVLSSDLRIETSTHIRRMQVGEIMEVIEGPAVDPSVGVYRVKGRALKDGICGWVTIAGNQGLTFLVPGGLVYKVRKALPLTQDLKDVSGEAAGGARRQLLEGEVVELLDWARTSRSALGLTRLRIKARSDGVVGWATYADSDGSSAVFLEAR